MIETFYLMITGIQIFLKPMYPYYKYEEVPQHAIHHCMDFTGINPYEKMTENEEVRIADCFIYKMGHYE